MIYFVSEPGGIAPVKIGFSTREKTLFKRFSSIQTGYPWKLELVHVCDGDYAVEAAIHKKLARHRLHGEWFQRDYVVNNFLRVLQSSGLDAALSKDYMLEPVKQFFGAKFKIRPADLSIESLDLAHRTISVLDGNWLISSEEAKRMMQATVPVKKRSAALEGVLFRFSKGRELLAEPRQILPVMHRNGVKTLFVGFSDRQISQIHMRDENSQLRYPNRRQLMESLPNEFEFDFGVQVEQGHLNVACPSP